VNRRERKQQETGEKLAARIFVIRAAGEVLVMRSFEGQDGRSLLVIAGEKRNEYIFLVEKREAKSPFRKLRRIWEDDIKMDFQEMQ
jgi:hypothetical protein